MLTVRLGCARRGFHTDNSAGFDTMIANYGTDMPHLQGDFERYLYGPGTIFVAHGPNENVTVGDLEASVEGYQKLVLHALGGKEKSDVGSEL